MEEITTDPKMQFHIKTKYVEIIGGLIFGLGFSAVIEKSIYYYGLIIVRFVFGPLFLDIEFFRDKN